jgi:uncharacterized protein YdeI (YjbR/CyaY-like superfamily)
MGKTDKRVDAYIEKSGAFAQPILRHLRALVHEANPDVEETIKWGFASFDYKGAYCSMASFKQHVAFGFWKPDLINDPDGYLLKRSNQGGEAMGNLGRITKMEDLPPDDILKDFIRQAKKLNDDGIKMPARPKPAKTELIIPDYFTTALQSNKKATEVFEKFSYSAKKEYVAWICEAKTEKTRLERLNTAIEWISEGKIRNWKYIKC